MRCISFLILIAAFTSEAWAADNLRSRDLSILAESAKREGLPILLIVSQHYCPFCVRLKEEIILPMQISGDYNNKVFMAEIMLDSNQKILDFKADMVRPGDIADSYKVWVTPTLLFLDHTGREVHKRMLGVNTIEMYGYFLDESLAAALQAVRNGDQSYIPTEKDIVGDAPGIDQMF